MFSVFPLCCCLVVSTSAINCLERLVPEMTYYVLSEMLSCTDSHCPSGQSYGSKFVHSRLASPMVCWVKSHLPTAPAVLHGRRWAVGAWHANNVQGSHCLAQNKFQYFPEPQQYITGPCRSPQQRVNIKRNSSYLLYI